MSSNAENMFEYSGQYVVSICANLCICTYLCQISHMSLKRLWPCRFFWFVHMLHTSGVDFEKVDFESVQHLKSPELQAESRLVSCRLSDGSRLLLSDQH